MRAKLSVNIGKIKLKNPVMVASGTFGYAEEFRDFINLKELGAIVTKTITLAPRQGNPPPRTCETPCGMLNSIGLENPGLELFIREKLPLLKKIGAPLIVSIASEDDPAEFVTLARRLDKIKEVAAIELNISCPNIKVHSQKFIVHSKKLRTTNYELRTKLISQDHRSTYAVVNSVRRVTNKTLITKLSPNVTDITEIALAAEKAGSDAVSLINTITGMSIDIKTRRPKIATLTAGLSGPAIRPVAVRMAWEVYQKIKIPIIGMGGITDTQSALEFFIAGATAISVGTANFINPRVTIEIIEGIKRYLIRNKIKDIKALIGSMKI
ncbi:MAG: dihydroorotate dehydrogenase [Candidatus Omnitrophota bacterium]|nr:dihydroorotate dehydrogenase [Candidatus Omnitrophota bacterium]